MTGRKPTAGLIHPPGANGATERESAKNHTGPFLFLGR